MSKKSKELGLTVIDTHMGLFDYTIRCVFGERDNAEQYVAYVFEEKETDHYEGFNRGYEARGTCYFRRGYVPIVWLPRPPETPREHATFAHEVIHAVHHLFEWSATPTIRDTEEVFAHSVAHVIANVYTKLELAQRLPQTGGQDEQ